MRNAERASATRVAALVVVLFVVLCVSVALALSHGAGAASVLDALSAESGDSARRIVLEVRMPRVLLAAVLGGALSVAGVAFQALLRNPLADPYVLGVSGGAALGRVFAAVAGVGAFGGWVEAFGLHASAFVGALAALLLIEWIATVDGRMTVYTILLTGAIFNAFSGALIYFLQSIATFEQLHAIVFALLGRVPALGYGAVAATAGATVLVVVGIVAMARDFNALSLGEEGAAQLGVEVERVKRRTFVLGSILTGIAVSVAGLIGFVGLVVPHVLRLSLGPDHRALLPASFLGGASFLVLADLVARVLIAPTELPVGVVTALVGGPFFLYLLRVRGRSHGFA